MVWVSFSWAVVVRRDLLDVDGHHVRLDAVENPPLLAEPRRTQVSELPSELFVVE
jgi:hypothetical protein